MTAEELAQRNWDHFLREDPQLARIEIGIAHAARIMATEPYSSPQFAQARAEDEKLRKRRREIFLERARETGFQLR